MILPPARLRRIDRFPIKSIGGESLEAIELLPRQAMPGDRRFAVMHEAALRHLVGHRLVKWLPRAAFLRGAAAPGLQAVRGGWQPDGRLRLTHPELGEIAFDPEAEDQSALLAWLTPLWQGKAPPARLVEGPQALTDVPDPFVSLLSLSSLADLEARLGRPLGTDRWRGNLWVDGWPPYAERDMRLMRLRIGGVLARVTQRIDRCPSTSADTRTGRLDGDMPAELLAQFDHDEFGIYLEILEGGRIQLGDPVELL